jgi:hypothetical protein
VYDLRSYMQRLSLFITYSTNKHYTVLPYSVLIYIKTNNLKKRLRIRRTVEHNNKKSLKKSIKLSFIVLDLLQNFSKSIELFTLCNTLYIQ